MTSSTFVLYLTCFFTWKIAQTTSLKFSPSVHEERGFVLADRGGHLTLPCMCEGNVAPRCYWYKQGLGQKLRLISSFYKFEQNGTFYDEFKNNPHFALDTANGKNHLMIKNLRISDSAIYYCMSCTLYTLQISESIMVSVRDSGLNIHTQVHQSASETIQPGGSVTLNCTVHTGTCAGEHSVYWFKRSEESQPRIIYTHGDKNNQCERKPDTPTHTCAYNLSMKSLNRSDAGTYYCAVASCGHILFGDGTKLKFEDNVALVYFLSGALTFTIILSVFLALSVYKMKKTNSCQSPEPQARFMAPSTRNDEVNRDTDRVHYAALNVTLRNESRRQKDKTQTDCVYSGLRQ